MAQKIFSKMHPVLCTYTHHDVIDLVNHGMLKKTKTWMSWKRNIIFLRNKKILNMCLRWHILRSYRFLAEVTFNVTLRQWFISAGHLLFARNYLVIFILASTFYLIFSIFYIIVLNVNNSKLCTPLPNFSSLEAATRGLKKCKNKNKCK